MVGTPGKKVIQFPTPMAEGGDKKALLRSMDDGHRGGVKKLNSMVNGGSMRLVLEDTAGSMRGRTV